jgi:hypothetical protein
MPTDLKGSRLPGGTNTSSLTDAMEAGEDVSLGACGWQSKGESNEIW